MSPAAIPAATISDHPLADYHLREQAGLSDRSDNRLQRELPDAAIAKIVLSDAETARVNVGGECDPQPR